MTDAQTPERCYECGMPATFHKFWLGDLLPMCRQCFDNYMRKKAR